MTEEEKIICKQFLNDADKTHSCNEYKLLMALLEQEPTTKNDLGVDCVARQDIERYIEGFINEYTPKEELEFINLELDGLKHLPSVTPQEPRQGHWKFQKITQGKRMWCSHCNSVFDLCCSQIKRYNEATRDNDIWAYCPWCGARMIEPQERSDKE